MIKSIELRCFRKHEDLKLNLGEGLQTLRAPNEAGKTTILEGAAYAMFGAKALRNSLAEVVTWGRKDTELRVTLTYEVDNDTTYTFTRSKAGAEVYRAGKAEPFVTGQAEVSNFAAGLIGADASVAAHLMMAGQGGLRGVLEQGPKATSTLIETLSDLDLIDRLIEAAGEKLQLGSTAVLADRLKQVELRQVDLQPVEEPTKPDFETLQADLNTLKGAVEKQAPITKIAIDMYQAEVNKREQRDRLERDRSVLLDQAEQVAKDMATAKGELRTDLPDLVKLQDVVRTCEEWETRSREYRIFSKLPEVTEYQSRDTFQAKMKLVTGERIKLRMDVFNANAEVSKIEPQISDSHTCPACGQDTGHLEAVKLKQQKLKADLAFYQGEVTRLTTEYDKADAIFQDLDNTLMLDGSVEKAAAGLRHHASRDVSFIPVKITWQGDIPCAEGPDVEAAKRDLANAEKMYAEQSKLQGRIEALSNTVTSLASRNAKIDKDISEIGLIDDMTFLKMEEAKVAEEGALAQAEGLVAMQQIVLEEAERKYKEAMHDFNRYQLEKKTLADSVEQLRKDIETTDFNNALVKKIRSARPIIANKLWNLVLTTVSTLFSQMRGETSVVAKGKDGFTVNGRPVESLSGSTQDILGLAIRCALIKTFVPACPFLILDEPSAACDADRSAALVGFVAAAGFRQVIMVTHEDVSESLSSNLIQIGE